ncbi:MAG: flavodoxin family protein [Firmicutes bacterium]|nr:flavodoxin family protein [Bacillota bacterium]
MKKVLAIMGSPRKNKNTNILLDSVIKGLKDKDVIVKKVYLRDLEINHCIACDYCAKTGKCKYSDDMVELYEEFNKSDGIIIASPLYFNSVNSIIKTMIDRCQAYWSSKYVLNKPSIDVNKKRVGLFISAAGSPHRKDQFEGCIPVINLFFKAINTEYRYNLFLSNTDKIDALQREDKLEKAYNIGFNYFKE